MLTSRYSASKIHFMDGYCSMAHNSHHPDAVT